MTPVQIEYRDLVRQYGFDVPNSYVMQIDADALGREFDGFLGSYTNGEAFYMLTQKNK